MCIAIPLPYISNNFRIRSKFIKSCTQSFEGYEHPTRAHIETKKFWCEFGHFALVTIVYLFNWLGFFFLLSAYHICTLLFQCHTSQLYNQVKIYESLHSIFSVLGKPRIKHPRASLPLVLLKQLNKYFLCKRYQSEDIITLLILKSLLPLCLIEGPG